MDFGTKLLVWMILGAIGLGYFVYGKRQSSVVAMLAGVALNIIPLFISSISVLLIVSAVLLLAPWFFRF